MLKVWNFTKNKLCHRYFDDYLKKMFRTDILVNGTGKIFFIVVLMVGLWLKFQMFRTDILENGTGKIFLIVALMVGLWLKFQMEIVD